MEFFESDLDTLGILYYSVTYPSIGKVYWKDELLLKAALNIKFPQSKIDTIRRIIATIKGN